MSLLATLVVATSGCGSCLKSKPPPPEEITQGLEDKSFYWFPKAYAALGLPDTMKRAEQWANEPARHATYTTAKDCQKNEFGICVLSKYEYRATNDDGSTVYVEWTSIGKFFRAELATQTEVRIFDFVHVPELGSVMVEVARGPVPADGGAEDLTRVPVGKLYDPYPAYKKAFDKLSQHDAARALVATYTNAFGPEDLRLAFDAYSSPRFVDIEARRQLALWLCGDVTEKKPVARAGTVFAKNDARAYQIEYEKLFASETAASPLGTILTECFAGKVLKLDTAMSIAKKLVGMTCRATDEQAYRTTEGVRDAYRKHRSGELAAFIKSEAEACPSGPWKERLLKELAPPTE